MKTNCNVQ